jgi:hypothetical protein
MALSAEKQKLFDALPVTGEVDYNSLRGQLITAGEKKALGTFHEMRRKGELSVRLEKNAETGELAMFVSRPVSG